MVPEISLQGYKATTRNHIMNPQLAAHIGAFLPERLQLRPEWHLKYSLEQHGASLTTLYEHSGRDPRDHQQRGYVLVVRDAKNGLFGAYTNVELKPVPHGMYQGNSDCLLWKVSDKADEGVAAYTYTGKNDFLVFCHHSYLSFGSGDGHPGLFIDQSLDSGRSMPSETYGNGVLSAQGERFDIIGLELWEV